MRSALRLSVVATSLLLVACFSSSVTDGNVEIDTDGDTMEVTTDQGKAVIGGELQSGWPSDVPVYPGAAVSYSALVNAEGGPGAAAVLTTADSPTEVVANLQAQLVAAGWTVNGQFNAGAMQTITATKDTRVYSVAIQGGEDGTTVTIGVGEQ